ncbi:type IV pilin [Natrinema halophilum]|uniref:Type IV pilin N-terminal domain-containing protein n=1 Tax=Natrinema halophilum TaxID=1699371 RepID=A0A7D5GN27_9EURY|nr:type IV pilin N-terminal domain-containing protein [Natrinema halophilum]QLG49033.1 type IV pilin N-terminal domain-containing protein [Natrinema halophilum]
MTDGKAIQRKLVGTADERAVSPVVGVILMVAITVILAAVIAAFLMDVGENQRAPGRAGVTINESASPHEVTLTSLGDNTDTVTCSAGGGQASSVGDTFDCPDGESVIAVTGDGSETVIRSDI